MKKFLITSHTNKFLIIFLVIGILLLCLIVLLCLFLFKDTFASSGIADINGEKITELAVITTEDILMKYDENISYLSITNRKGTKTNTSYRLRECDSDQVRFKCKSISGVKTIQATRTSHAKVTLEIDLQLISGNAEVFVIVDDQCYATVGGNQREMITIRDAAEKTIVVKVGAESAEINLSVSRKLHSERPDYTTNIQQDVRSQQQKSPTLRLGISL